MKRKTIIDCSLNLLHGKRTTIKTYQVLVYMRYIPEGDGTPMGKKEKSRELGA